MAKIGYAILDKYTNEYLIKDDNWACYSPHVDHYEIKPLVFKTKIAAEKEIKKLTKSFLRQSPDNIIDFNICIVNSITTYKILETE